MNRVLQPENHELVPTLVWKLKRKLTKIEMNSQLRVVHPKPLQNYIVVVWPGRLRAHDQNFRTQTRTVEQSPSSHRATK